MWNGNISGEIICVNTVAESFHGIKQKIFPTNGELFKFTTAPFMKLTCSRYNLFQNETISRKKERNRTSLIDIWIDIWIDIIIGR